MPNGIVGEGGKIRSGFLFIYIYFKFTDWISWDGVYEPLIFLQLLWSRLLCSLGFRKCWNGTFNVLVKYILSVSMQSVSNPVHSCSRPIDFQFSCSIDVGHGTAGNIADSQLRSSGSILILLYYLYVGFLPMCMLPGEGPVYHLSTCERLSPKIPGSALTLTRIKWLYMSI